MTIPEELRTYKSTECLKVKCKLCAVLLGHKLATKVTSGTSILGTGRTECLQVN